MLNITLPPGPSIQLDKSEAGLDADTAARSAANTSTTTPTPHGAPATTKRTGGVDFDERKERTLDDMAAEAQRLRVFFKDVNEASGLE